MGGNALIQELGLHWREQAERVGLGQQVVVCVMAMLAAVGAPGIPSAGMVTMVMVLQSVGLPAEAIAILLPIDRILDSLRTVVNVEGDIVGSIVVDHLTLRAEAQDAPRAAG